MINKYLVLIVSFLIGSTLIKAQGNKVFETKSPDSNIILHIESGTKFLWSVQLKGEQIIAPSAISLQLQTGEVLGDNAKILSFHSEKNDSKINSINYKKSIISDQYNQLTINCKGDYGVIFRVYNDGVAYRFFMKRKTDIIIKNEGADFNFPVDHKAFIPYSRDYHKTRFFNYSCFEAGYSVCNISQFGTDSLALLPLLVDIGNNNKVVILEADLEDYPGMYLNVNGTRKGFAEVFPPYPLETNNPGADIYMVPTEVAGYIARTNGTRNYPWRAVVISQSDKELLNNDMVQKLASPSRITDISWIQPGQVAWDWWNDLNISHVDFKAGVNNPTFKYYIDFAAANKIKYIIMDGWWSESLDLFKVTPTLNIQEIVDYGKEKGVGVILWAAWYTVTQQMDKAFPFYSKMGIKGFKIDFVDRDDQLAVASLYEIARKAADYHLLVDYHGVFKPTGLQRTYPNVVGFEGVKGMENYKWAPIEDAPFNAVCIPFIRMMAGPMDYTPGAMKNTSRSRFWPLNASPMSQGTRSNQMAMYVVYEAPIQMLSDNPTIYMKEQECTDFITSIPTTFDETVALDGNVGEYAALARRKGDTWYAGAITNWDARDLTIDFSFLGAGTYEAVIFKDGINSDREATDYKREVIKISANDRLSIHLAPGGGWTSRIRKIDEKSWSKEIAKTFMERYPDPLDFPWGSWCYPQGYMLLGIEKLWESTGDKKYYDYIMKFVNEAVDSSGYIKQFDGNSLDIIMPGATVVWAYKQTGLEKYKKAAEQIRRSFVGYPRTSDSLFWHGRSLKGEVWIDGSFMGQIFLARYGKYVAASAYCFREAARQLIGMHSHLKKGNTGLMYHAWDEDHDAPWADKKTGLSPEVWSEGLGWYALALVETLDIYPKNNPYRAELETIDRELMKSLKNYQDLKTGLWYDIVDKGDMPANFNDPSGSSMFLYAMKKSIELGLISEDEYEGVVNKAYTGLITKAMINQIDGLVDITGGCDGVCVQTSYDKYVNYEKKINAKETIDGFLWGTWIVEKSHSQK